MVVHLHLEFKSDYPMRPPTVKILTPLEGHPNIFGDYICLDMLTQVGLSCGLTASSLAPCRPHGLPPRPPRYTHG